MRLLCPLAIGVWLGDLSFFEQGEIPLYLFLISLLCFLFLVTFGFLFRRYSFRWLFGTLLTVILFLTGWLLAFSSLKQINHQFCKGSTIYKLKVEDTPQIREKSIRLKSDIEGMASNGLIKPFKAKAVLYFAKDSALFHLHRGDILLIAAHIAPPASRGNPDGFDYAKYLLRHGIGGSGFVSSGHWRRIGHVEENDLMTMAFECREHILALYHSFGWNQEVYNVVSALTVGYKDGLSDEIRQTYSIAGASHVLALSGLHIGFICCFLSFILSFLKRRPSGNFIRGFMMILFLWIFAFITGLSVSVVRSVIMFSFFVVARMYKRDYSSLNILAAAAFLMLLFSPEWLFDVGFELSFCAVASILLFLPYIDMLYSPRTKVGRYFWQLITLSLAAQIVVGPLIVYYFSRFSVHFILSGLVVIPLASCIIGLAIALLLTGAIPAVQSFLADIMARLVQMQNDILRWIERLPHASIDGIYLYPSELALFYVSLCALLLFLHLKRVRYMFAFLATLSFVLLLHIYYFTEDFATDRIAFYNIRSCPAVHCISSSGNSWLVCANQQCDVEDMTRQMSQYWHHIRIGKPQTVINDYAASTFRYQSGIVCYKNLRIGIICDNRWRYQCTDNPFSVDYLYICRGYKGKLEELLSVFDARRIVLDGSLSQWRQKHYADACMRHQIPYTQLSAGAFILPISSQPALL